MRMPSRKGFFAPAVPLCLLIFCLVTAAALGQPGALSVAREQQKAKLGSDSPSNFYRRFAEAITDLDGHALLYFNSGVWVTKSIEAGGSVRWRIDDGTIGDMRVTYTNRALASAEIKFNKPIHIWLPIDGGVSFSVQDLQYDDNGLLINDDRKPDNPHSAHYQGAARTDRIFQLETRPDLMMKGELFSNIDSISKCDVNNQNCAPQSTSLVYEVELKTIPNSPGLSVSLGPPSGPGVPNMTSLPITLPNLANSAPNYLDLQAGSSVVIYSLKYFVDEHYLDVNLQNLTLRLADGQISTGDLSLSMTSGSVFTLQNVSFTHDQSAPATNQIKMDDGYLVAGIGSGSRIQISKASPGNADTESYLVARDGSSVELKGIAIAQSDTGGTVVNWNNQSKQTLYVQSGVLNIGNGAFINLASSSVVMNLAGAWKLGKAPAVSATDVLIDASVSGAQLPINTASVLRLGSGHFHGDHLSIDSTTKPIVRGTVNVFDVVILPQTTIAFPGAIKLVTDADSHFSLDPSSPALQFGVASNFPVGRYLLDAHFSVFDNGSAAKNFELQNGRAILPTETLADGTIQTPSTPALEPWKITGKLLMSPAGGTALNIDTTIDNGRFHTTMGGHPSFAATLSGTVEGGFTWAFTTPSEGLNGQPSVAVPSPLSNFRAYPVKLTLGLTKDAVIPPTPFTIGDNSIASANFQFDIKFALTPGTGSGEHEDDGDPNSAKGGGSPDPPVHGWQEVVQVHAGAGGDFVVGCQGHLYIAPVSHSGTLTTQVVVNPASVTVNITKFGFDQPLAEHSDYEHDGCDVSPLLGAVGGVVGGLPGIIGGLLFGHVVNAKVDDLIAERLNDFITSQSGQSWTLHYSY